MIARTGALTPSQVHWLRNRIPAFGDLCRAGAEFRARAAEVSIARANDAEIAMRKRAVPSRRQTASITVPFPQPKVRR